MIKKINHIGIAVKSIADSISFYKDILKLKYLGIETVPEQKVRVAMFQIGEVNIELLEPTVPESPVAKFLEKRGEGIHHIAYQTENIDKTIETLIQSGIEMIDTESRQGAHECRIAFIHPRSSMKILTELCEVKGEAHE